MGLMNDVPRSELFDDVYFSAEDGPAETAHVFLNGNNLAARWQGAERFAIGETGFGTGLNFLLAWELFDRTAPKNAFLDFVSVEKYPMSVEDIEKGLSPWAERLSPYLEKMLDIYPIRANGFHRIIFDNRVALTLIFGDANEALPEIQGNIDAWFLDGFTPSKNPDMWSQKVFDEMARLSHAGTTFATFTSAGFVKRGLHAAGFTVEKKDGFGRKRDMLAGYFAGTRVALPKVRDKKVAIYGAGLAGTSCAYVLRQYGFNPVMIDPNGIASGSSGNPVGLINPRFTAFKNAESDFYTAGFAQTVRTFKNFTDVDYLRCGSLHLITDDDKEKRFVRTVENWEWHQDHLQILSSQGASDVCGVTLDKNALYVPDSAQINPSKLCAAYARGVEISTEAVEADFVIYANGTMTPDLPLHTVRGQITMADATNESRNIKTNICYGGYISAPLDGKHVIGSTFQKWLSHSDSLAEDDAENLQNLSQNVPALTDIVSNGGRASLRVASKDRFPVIGHLGESRYISTAHGSHGIVSSLAGAHAIADLLRGGPMSLGKSSLNALCPHRFKNREERKKS